MPNFEKKRAKIQISTFSEKFDSYFDPRNKFWGPRVKIEFLSKNSDC
jgi:hypothetical protein